MPRYIIKVESQTMWFDLSLLCLQQKFLHIHIWIVKIIGQSRDFDHPVCTGGSDLI